MLEYLTEIEEQNQLEYCQGEADEKNKGRRSREEMVRGGDKEVRSEGSRGERGG